jgi:hypothetical protein
LRRDFRAIDPDLLTFIPSRLNSRSPSGDNGLWQQTKRPFVTHQTGLNLEHQTQVTRLLELAAAGERQAAEDRAEVRKVWRWQHDRRLASLRDEPALAKLPAEECEAFNQFWADVARMLKKVEDDAK